MKDERLTKEVLKMAAEAKSAEALEASLAEAKVEATPEEIRTLYDNVHKELSEDELGKVTGGFEWNEGDDSTKCQIV